MSIYLRCPNCKAEQNINNKVCIKCNYQLSKNQRIYRIVVKHNRKLVRKQIHGSLTLAKNIEAKIKAELANGDYFDRKRSITYDDFMKRKYLPFAMSKKSYAREETLYRLWIKPVIGSKAIDNISPFDLEKLKKQMAEAGKAPRTIQYALAVVKHSFNKAADWGYTAAINPASRVKSPKVNNRRSRFLTKEETEMLLIECRKRSRQLYEIALLSLHCGLRAGETFNLTYKDIDLENGIINIRDPKNGEDRAAYMTGTVKEMFKGKKGDADELIFKNKNGNKIIDISYRYKPIIDKLEFNNGIKDSRNRVVFHTLRHTFASRLAMQGTPIFVIKELLGHKSLTMTERYSHLLPGTKREAIRKLEQGIGNKTDIISLEAK